jgi:serine/threonine protein kinase
MGCRACDKSNKPNARSSAIPYRALDRETGPLQPDQLIGKDAYRIIRPLGEGGMGAVYLAANTRAFDRPCVVKEVIEYYDPTDPEARHDAVQRFEAEARTLASLKHPGIPDIYAYFSERGHNYLVMEYIEGPNLAQGLTHEQDGRIVKGRPQPVQDVARHTIQICEVLIYLQQRRPPVIHNDIKPANIILDKNSRRAVLVDFGTARVRYAHQVAGQPGRQQSSIYGTEGYAAPELYDGQAEPRSDVYALAATVYHLLTDDDPRTHPFRFRKMDTLPEPLRPVLRDALRTDVDARPSAAEFARRLANAAHLARVPPGSAASVPAFASPQEEQVQAGLQKRDVWLMTDPVARARYEFSGTVDELEHDIRYEVMRGQGWSEVDRAYLREIARLERAGTVRRLASFWAVSPHPPVYRALADGEMQLGGKRVAFHKGNEITWACPMTRDQFGLDVPVLIGDFQDERVQRLCGEMANAMQGRMTKKSLHRASSGSPVASPAGESG